MAGERRYMNRINGWAQVIAGATSNPTQTEHLQPGVVRLQNLHTRAGELSAKQAAFTAAKQETTQELQRVLREGDGVADFIRTGARAHFGADSEKMVEFGMQPFRGVKPSDGEGKGRKRKPKAPTTSEPETGSPAPDSLP